MKINPFKKMTGGALLFVFGAALSLHAQFRPGFGGFGAFNRNNAAANSGAGQYNNNGSVGTATIYVDPDTKNLVVITDQQTSMEIETRLRPIGVRRAETHGAWP